MAADDEATTTVGRISDSASAEYVAHDIQLPLDGVPPGYKRTEIGIIPEDWNAFVVGDIARIKGGKRLPAGHELVANPTRHPYIRVSDIYEGGVDTSELKYVPNGTFPAIKHYRIYAEDVFITVAGTIGIVGIIPKTLSGANLTENADRLTDIQCEQHYLMYWLMSRSIQNAIESIRTVGAQPKLALTRIAQFPIVLPGHPVEQHAIATALSDVDGLIDALDKLIAKKRAIKQAAMQQLLTGRTRLPGFSGAWETKRLGNVAIFHKGSGLPKSEISPNGQHRCIHYGELFTIYNERIQNIVSGTDNAGSRFYSESNDVLMPTSDVTPNGLATASCVPSPDVILGGDILVIRSDPAEINGEFLAYSVKANRNQVMQLVTGTTVFHLYGRDMANFVFTAPSIEEQTAIATVLSDMDAEIDALEQRRAKTRELKTGMMQQLLTGRIRLVQREAQPAESAT